MKNKVETLFILTRLYFEYKFIELISNKLCVPINSKLNLEDWFSYSHNRIALFKII